MKRIETLLCLALTWLPASGPWTAATCRAADPFPPGCSPACVPAFASTDETPPATAEPQPKKGPKTLFDWAEPKKDKKENGKDKKDDGKDGEKNGKEEDKNGNGKEKDKNGNGNGKDEEENDEDEEEEDDEIVTDRPDFTEASSTVGKGRIQLESGYTYIRDREGSASYHGHSYPEMLLRIGMFAEWFELRIGQNFSNERNAEGDVIDNFGGGQDLYLGVKLGLTEQKKVRPEMALLLQTTVPTGHSDVTAGQLQPGVCLLYGWDVIPDCISTAGSTQANRRLDDVDHFYVQVAQSWTIGYSLTKRLGAYTEWFAFFPCSSIDPDLGPEHYVDGGFTYKVTANFQLDVRAGLGLNRHADDYFTGAGFAVRY